MTDDVHKDQSPPALQFPSRARQAVSRGFDAAAYLEHMAGGGSEVETVPTGFPSLDALLGGGIRRGDLVVLGGDVSCGKSSLALAIALRGARIGRAVAYLSGEMTVERLTERAIAVEGRVSIDDLRAGVLDDPSHAAAAAVSLRLRDHPPVFALLPDSGVSGVSDLTVEYLGLELVVIDPLQALAAGSGMLDEELARAMRDLKDLAIRRGTAILLVSHLAATPRGRADPRPRLEDFGALGAVRQWADIVLGLFREELYVPVSDVEGAAELHVLKNRNGPTGYIDLYFYRKWMRFEDMLEPNR
jgi:replicative DNA helicase